MTDFVKGKVYSNREILNRLKCACEGGIRYSKATSTIALFTSAPENFFDNAANTKDGEKINFDYIGQGKFGDQTMTRNNKRLKEFLEAKGDVYFFLREQPDYKYMGKAYLNGQIHQIEQRDANRDLRKVYVFPLLIE